MSDTSQGEGWWVASDGKWYPPDTAGGEMSTAKKKSLRGRLDKFTDRATEIGTDELAESLSGFLVDGEIVEAGFRLARDQIAFTNKRLITIDKQGLTSKKTNFRSIPYSKITQFSKEAAGRFDLDAELKLWIGSASEPLSFEFSKDSPIDDVYLILSKYILG